MNIKTTWNVTNIKIYDKVAFFSFRGARANEGGNGKTFNKKIMSYLSNFVNNNDINCMITPLIWFPTIEKWSGQNDGSKQWRHFVVVEEIEETGMELPTLPQTQTQTQEQVAEEVLLSSEEKIQILVEKMKKFYPPQHEDLIKALGNKAAQKVVLDNDWGFDLTSDEEIYKQFFNAFIEEFENYTGTKVNEDDKEKQFKQIQIRENGELF